MESFEFHRPSTVEEAKALLAARVDGKFLGGGQSLIPVMKLDLAAPSDLICLKGLRELKGIEVRDGRVVVGASVTHAEVETSRLIRQSLPALAKLAHGIGDAQVRNRGTLGGSIAHADPQADYPAAVVALDGRVETDQRTIDADAFFTGLFETALERDEIITAVHFRAVDRAAYAKFPNPASKYAIVGVMVATWGDEVRVAVTGAGPKVFRLTDMERALSKNFAPEALASIEVDPTDFLDELDAGPDYRAHLVKVMAARAVAAA
ncbi:MAG: FAD binding domain-containing protein [Myxococcota bacterium]